MDNMGKNKKTANYVITIIALVFATTVLLIYMIGFAINIFKYSKKQEERKEEIQTNVEIEEAKQKAEEYLYNRYNQKFNLKLSSTGYKAKESEFDAQTVRCGHDENIKQYVFIGSVDETNFYITVWKNIETEEFEIQEVNGEISNEDDRGYELTTKLRNEKEEIKEKLDEMLKNNYTDYEVDYNYKTAYEQEHNYEGKRINLKFNHSFREELKNNLKNINFIIDLVQGKDIGIYVKFTDYTQLYKKAYSDIEDEREKFKKGNEICEYLEENYAGQYSEVKLSGYSISIKMPINIKEKYYSIEKEKYSKIFNDLSRLADTVGMEVEVEFNDETASFDSLYYDQTLEEYMKQWEND